MLKGVDWRLQLTMGHKDLSKTKDISAIFNFQLGQSDATEVCLALLRTQWSCAVLTAVRSART